VELFGGQFFLFAFHAHLFELALFASMAAVTSCYQLCRLQSSFGYRH
jgi:hypothetical protein